MKLSFVRTKTLISHLSLALMLAFHCGVWKTNVCSWRPFLKWTKAVGSEYIRFPLVTVRLLAPNALSTIQLDPRHSKVLLPRRGKLQSSAAGQAQSKVGPDDMNLCRWTPTESYVCLLRSGVEWPRQCRIGSLRGYALTVPWAWGSQCVGVVGFPVIITYPVLFSVERKL